MTGVPEPVGEFALHGVGRTREAAAVLVQHAGKIPFGASHADACVSRKRCDKRPCRLLQLAAVGVTHAISCE